MKDGIFCETITQKIKEITSPYELYISPYTQNVYFTDAGSYGSAGYLYGYTKRGTAGVCAAENVCESGAYPGFADL